MHCPWRTTPRAHYATQNGGLQANCLKASCLNVVSRRTLQRRHRVVAVQAAANNFYEALGVGQDASDRDIKRAYRQKALKLHPDVNKAPNAQEQFLEVKNAFQVLSDPQQRAQYDRQLRGGFGDFGSWGSYGSWGSTASSSSSSTGSRPRPQQQQEDFYGLGDLLHEVGSAVGGWVQQAEQELSQISNGVKVVLQEAGHAIKDGKIEDFFKDLDKEIDEWSKKRASSGKPASLWEELNAIGEEFVDFLEQGLREEQRSSSSSTAGKEGSSSGGSSSFNGSSARKARSPVDKYEELKRQYDLFDGAQKASRSSTSSSSSSQRSAPPPPPPPPPKKTADEEIDDMLAALKKKMNKA